jgi:dUTP pyrophosphatase
MKFTLEQNAFPPEYAHSTDAGMDIRSPIDIVIPARRTMLVGYYLEPGYAVIHTGIHIQLPKNTVGFFKSKSGLNVKYGITSEGVIDEGYTGELVVKLYNHGTNDYKVYVGDKITQLVVLPYVHVDLEEAETLDDSERGNNGFGSTGK